VSLVRGLIGCLTDRQFWYIFGWLLPLGALRMRDMPPAWVGASLGGAAAALAMGAWINAGGVAAPAVFNAIGPILSLSAAALLTLAAEPRSSRLRPAQLVTSSLVSADDTRRGDRARSRAAPAIRTGIVRSRRGSACGTGTRTAG
jgi:hypothetical protein